MDVAPRFLGSGVDGGLAPADLRSAYDLSGQGGTGTIAIVDPFGDPTAEADLSVYRAHYGLPPCTSANGCFRKLDQRGGSAFPPIAPDGEAGENALDLDMASAMCPRCRQAGMMTTVVAGSVGFIVGVFLGITIAKA